MPPRPPTRWPETLTAPYGLPHGPLSGLGGSPCGPPALHAAWDYNASPAVARPIPNGDPQRCSPTTGAQQ
eukprot:9504118-Pyramimonas_sp.AAC.3